MIEGAFVYLPAAYFSKLVLFVSNPAMTQISPYPFSSLHHNIMWYSLRRRRCPCIDSIKRVNSLLYCRWSVRSSARFRSAVRPLNNARLVNKPTNSLLFLLLPRLPRLLTRTLLPSLDVVRVDAKIADLAECAEMQFLNLTKSYSKRLSR